MPSAKCLIMVACGRGLLGLPVKFLVVCEGTNPWQWNSSDPYVWSREYHPWKTSNKSLRRSKESSASDFEPFASSAPRLTSSPWFICGDQHLLEKEMHLGAIFTDIIWKSWKREYLPLLQQRQKWFNPRRNFTVGDNIILVNDSTFRNVWPIGCISEVFPDNQGMVWRLQLKSVLSLSCAFWNHVSICTKFPDCWCCSKEGMLLSMNHFCYLCCFSIEQRRSCQQKHWHVHFVTESDKTTTSCQVNQPLWSSWNSWQQRAEFSWTEKKFPQQPCPKDEVELHVEVMIPYLWIAMCKANVALTHEVSHLDALPKLVKATPRPGHCHSIGLRQEPIRCNLYWANPFPISFINRKIFISTQLE